MSALGGNHINSELAQAFPRVLCAVTVADFPGRVFAVTASYSNAGLPTFIRRRTASGYLTYRSYNAKSLRIESSLCVNFLRGSFVDCVPEAFLCPPKALQGRSGESADVFHDVRCSEVKSLTRSPTWSFAYPSKFCRRT